MGGCQAHESRHQGGLHRPGALPTVDVMKQALQQELESTLQCLQVLLLAPWLSALQQRCPPPLPPLPGCSRDAPRGSVAISAVHAAIALATKVLWKGSTGPPLEATIAPAAGAGQAEGEAGGGCELLPVGGWRQRRRAAAPRSTASLARSTCSDGIRTCSSVLYEQRGSECATGLHASVAAGPSQPLPDPAGLQSSMQVHIKLLLRRSGAPSGATVPPAAAATTTRRSSLKQRSGSTVKQKRSRQREAGMRSELLLLCGGGTTHYIDNYIDI